MTSRSVVLKKIEKVYGLIETMHSVALQQAVSLVHEAEDALAAQGSRLRAAKADSQQALHEGDREMWAVSEVDLAMGTLRLQRLEELRKARDASRERAREVYGASRIQRGQIKSVVETQAAAEQIVDERRAQTVSDDRFLSRLRWAQMQAIAESV